MYHTEYNAIKKELEMLQAIPDSDKDDDIKEDIKSLLILLSQSTPDGCIEGTCEF